MDVVTLSRIQFALNISFHYIFPPLSIGLGLMLVLIEGAYLWTKHSVYERMAHFWTKIFGLIFAVGVGTGLVQVFGFGTNWSQFSRFVGDVFGSILGAEGIFAFFLEAGFLGVLLFGWHRVGPKMHFFSTVMVALGAHFSAVWIVIANSWMQTPHGHELVGEGTARHAVIKSWWAVLNNPSSFDRLTHVLIAAWLTGAFLVLSVSAFYLLKKRHIDFALRSFKISSLVAGFLVLLQLFSGHSSSKGVATYQPIKLAAFEGVYQTETPTGMWAMGYVVPAEEKVVGLALPGMLSFLLYGNLSKPAPALDQVPRELWPNVAVVFQMYHGMIAMWGCMLLSVVLAFIAWTRGKIAESRWSLRFLIISVIFPELANQLGWYAAEMGRQPWVVQGLLRTSEGVSPYLSREQVIFSLTLFSLIYALIFALFIFLLDRKIRHGPEDHVERRETDLDRDPYQNLSIYRK